MKKKTKFAPAMNRENTQKRKNKYDSKSFTIEATSANNYKIVYNAEVIYKYWILEIHQNRLGHCRVSLSNSLHQYWTFVEKVERYFNY